MLNTNCHFILEDANTNRKTLFQEAVSSAKNGKVLFILHEELTEIPELSQDLSLVNRHYMRSISFLYVKSLESLLESVSTLPDWQNVPSIFILEDLEGFCKNNLQTACAVVAMLKDAARSCSKALNVPTKLIISVTKGTFSNDISMFLQELYCTDV